MTLKRVQVNGERHKLTEEEAEIQKLIRQALRIKAKLAEVKAEFAEVEGRLFDIAERRREGRTTVELKAVSGDAALVTYRESYEPSDRVEELKRDLGPTLWERFFEKKIGFKTKKDLKRLLEEGHGFGLKDLDQVKGQVLEYVTKKVTKPSLKLTAAGG